MSARWGQPADTSVVEDMGVRGVTVLVAFAVLAALVIAGMLL